MDYNKMEMDARNIAALLREKESLHENITRVLHAKYLEVDCDRYKIGFSNDDFEYIRPFVVTNLEKRIKDIEDELSKYTITKK